MRPRNPKAVQAPPAAIEWPRADPAELAAFDPSTRRCTMNCGPSGLDPRSRAERLLLCDDCETVAPVRDTLGAWPVIDGPAKGQRIACDRDRFDMLLDPFMPAPPLLHPPRVRYYLHAQVRGGYVWSCAAPRA